MDVRQLIKLDLSFLGRFQYREDWNCLACIPANSPDETPCIPLVNISQSSFHRPVVCHYQHESSKRNTIPESLNVVYELPINGTPIPELKACDENLLPVRSVMALLSASSDGDKQATKQLQSFSIFGIIKAKSFVTRFSKSNCGFMLTLQDDKYDSSVTSILFLGASLACYREFLRIGDTLAVKNVRTMSMSSSHSKTSIIFVTDCVSFIFRLSNNNVNSLSAKNLPDSQEFSTMPPWSCVPSNSQEQAETLVSYQGTVTNTELLYSLGIFELDDLYSVILPTQHLSWYFGLRRGAVVSLHNAHVLLLDAETQKIAFGLCDYSTFDLVKSAPAPKDPIQIGSLTASGYSFHGMLWMAQVLEILKSTLANVSGSTSTKLLHTIVSSLSKEFKKDLSSTDIITHFQRHRTECPMMFHCTRPKLLSIGQLLEFAKQRYAKPNGTHVHHVSISGKEHNIILVAILRANLKRCELVLEDATGSVSLQSTNSLQAPFVEPDLDSIWLLSDFQVIIETICPPVGSSNDPLRRVYIRCDPSATKCLVRSRTLPIHRTIDTKILFVTSVLGPYLSPELKLGFQVTGVLLSFNSDPTGTISMCGEEQNVVVEFHGEASSLCPTVHAGTFYVLSEFEMHSLDSELYITVQKRSSLRAVNLTFADKCSIRLLNVSHDRVIKWPVTEAFWQKIECTISSFLSQIHLTTIRSLLDVDLSLDEQDTRLGSGYLSKLCSFEGILLAKELKPSDSMFRGHDIATVENFNAFGTGLGRPAVVLLLRFKDLETMDVVDVYVDIFKSRYPLGLIPGSIVTCLNIARKVSKSDRIYCFSVACSSFLTGPWMHNRSEIQYDVKRTKMDPPTETKFTFLADIIGKDTQRRSIMQFRLKILFIEKIVLRWNCIACNLVIQNNQCPNSCDDSYRRFQIDLVASVYDGTGEAQLNVSNEDLVAYILCLNDFQMNELQNRSLFIGEISVEKLPPWKEHDSSPISSPFHSDSEKDENDDDNMFLKRHQARVSEAESFLNNIINSKRWKRALIVEARVYRRKRSFRLPRDLKHLEKNLGPTFPTLTDRWIKISGINLKTLSYPKLTLLAQNVRDDVSWSKRWLTELGNSEE